MNDELKSALKRAMYDNACEYKVLEARMHRADAMRRAGVAFFAFAGCAWGLMLARGAHGYARTLLLVAAGYYFWRGAADLWAAVPAYRKAVDAERSARVWRMVFGSGDVSL